MTLPDLLVGSVPLVEVEEDNILVDPFGTLMSRQPIYSPKTDSGFWLPEPEGPGSQEWWWFVSQGIWLRRANPMTPTITWWAEHHSAKLWYLAQTPVWHKLPVVAASR